MDSHDNPTEKVLLSSEDIAVVVKNSVGPTAKLLSYRIEKFSKETSGFMGSHHRLTTTYKKEDGDEETRSFFVKCMPHTKTQRELCLDTRVNLKETVFYRDLVPEFLKSVKDRSWCSPCYLANEEALVFEDLSSRNFALAGKLFDVEHVRSALSSLAKLHASSLLTQRRQGEDFLRGVYPEILKENLFVRAGLMNPWRITCTNTALMITRNLGLSDERVAEFIDRVYDIAAAPSEKWNVVCHGDPWMNNFLFDDSKPTPQCIPVDYQLARYASPLFDVSQLIYFSTRRAFRDLHERELLTHYHRVLSETLRENDEQIELPLLDDVLEEYEEMRVVGIGSAVSYFPVILVNSKLAEDLIQDFEQLLFKDRNDFVLSMMKKDKIYEERHNEIVQEMIERTEKLLGPKK